MFPAADEALAARVGQLLAQHQLTLATAESCTGGLISALLTEVAGSSAWFERGFVTYSNAAKQQMLGVPDPVLARYGAVSVEVAAAMVEGALRHSLAGLALGVTGVAGPGGGTPRKPVGTVCIAWGCRDLGVAATTRYHLQGSRAEIRAAAARLALTGIELLIRGGKKGLPPPGPGGIDPIGEIR